MKTKLSLFSIICFFAFLLLLATAISGCIFTKPKNTADVTEGLIEEDENLESVVKESLTESERESLKERLLQNCTFYKGRVTIFENQKWNSKWSDGSFGFGDTTLSTDEILVYDANTRKTYIIVRYMSCTGWHHITINDLNGNNIGEADVTHSGELYEFYGTGLLWRKNLENPNSSGTSLIDQFTLNFNANPVRIDNQRNIIFTYPMPRQTSWVTYFSISGAERRGDARIWPPEENPKNTTLNQVPALNTISGNNTYNSSETQVFEETDRVWTPSGTFSYDYYRISYAEAVAELKKLQLEVIAAGSFGAMAAKLPSAWQETAKLADKMQAVATAANDLSSIVETVKTTDVNDKTRAINAADALANEPKVLSDIKTFEQGMAYMGGSTTDDSAMRKLEGVIIETSDESDAGPQQKNLKNTFNEVKQYLIELFRQYYDVYESLQSTIIALRESLDYSDENSAENLVDLVKSYEEQVQIASELNEQIEILLGDIGVILNDLHQQGDQDDESEYAELNRLFETWKDTLQTLENVEIDVTGGVDLPHGYPGDIVPIIDGAVIAIAEKIPGEGGPDGFEITLKTDKSVEEIKEYYTSVLRESDEFEIFSYNDITTLSGIKDEYEFGIMIRKNNLGGTEKMAIQISLTPVE